MEKTETFPGMLRDGSPWLATNRKWAPGSIASAMGRTAFGAVPAADVETFVVELADVREPSLFTVKVETSSEPKLAAYAKVCLGSNKRLVGWVPVLAGFPTVVRTPLLELRMPVERLNE
jgi:hypothetical protein